MKARAIIIAATFLFGVAVYGLHTDKMRVSTTCRDSRLYMDGGIDANVESGGLNYHHTIELYKLSNRKHEHIGSFLVSAVSSPNEANQTYLSGTDLKLSIFKTEPTTSQGFLGHLEGQIKGEKLSIDLRCIAKAY